MNREQKRAYKRKLRAKGYPDEKIDKLIALKEMKASSNSLGEGDTVQLDVEKIKSHPTWAKSQPAYKEFVEKNKRVIFNVEYDEKHPDHKLVCLKQDTSELKWLWWEGDLIKVKL